MILCRHQFFQVKEVEDGYWFKCKYCNTQVHGKIAMHNPYQGSAVVHTGATSGAKTEVARGGARQEVQGTSGDGGTTRANDG